LQAAVDAGKLDEDTLMAESHISLEDHLKHSDITKLIQSPVEVIAFCEEEGVRYHTPFPFITEKDQTKQSSLAHNSTQYSASRDCYKVGSQTRHLTQRVSSS
jgi:hypothetical protein